MFFSNRCIFIISCLFIFLFNVGTVRAETNPPPERSISTSDVDLNADGVVNIKDLMIFMQRWKETNNASQPEILTAGDSVESVTGEQGDPQKIPPVETLKHGDSEPVGFLMK